MSCRAGDRAVVVGGGIPENIGSLIHVDSPHPNPETWCVTPLSTLWSDRLRRRVAPSEPEAWRCRDNCLRPLRDSPGEDEMLRITELENAK